MRVLVASALPEVCRRLGLAHHLPGAEPGPNADGLEVVEISGDVPDPGPDGAIAHLTGTSPALLAAAERLGEAGIPLVHSPMLAVLPGGFERFASRAVGYRTDAVLELRTAAAIGRIAAAVLARPGGVEARLLAGAGVAASRILELTGPRLPGPQAGPVPADPAGGVVAADPAGGVVAAICNRLDGRWNVERFLAAMEKVNADAVVVTADGGGPGAVGIRERAARNPRVRIVEAGSGFAGADLARRAAVIVDPSIRGLAGHVAAAAAAAGIPAAVSGRSSWAGPGAPPLLSTFEPSSWELLHHAITTALNLSVERSRAGAGAGSSSGGSSSGESSPDGDEGDAGALRKRLRDVYREAARPSGGGR